MGKGWGQFSVAADCAGGKSQIGTPRLVMPDDMTSAQDALLEHLGIANPVLQSDWVTPTDTAQVIACVGILLGPAS